ncbi:MAG: polyribonucleotide nucleotidyltransferase [Chitinophagales bacterium]|nr:polyribonucleotide nucleotidyltransferase [Chitinophagales bacterium]
MSQIGITKSFDLGDGRIVSLETGKLAKQADGSVVVRMGNTMLLATIVSDQDAREGVDFLPLTVEYQEKYASLGRFPGGFFKREARASEYEILISRLVDRALRPLFPDDYHANTQVIINLISGDKDVNPDILACLGASAAIAVSDIPFNGPISEVRVGRIDGKFIVNPTIPQTEQSDIDMVVAATQDSVVMVEGEMKEVSEEDMVEAIKFAHDHIRIQLKAINELAEAFGKKAAREYSHEVNDLTFKERVVKATYDQVVLAMSQPKGKHERRDELKRIKEEFVATLTEEEAALFGALVGKYYHDVEKMAARNLILERGHRLDGRKMNEIRPIWSEVDYLPSAHGSAIFTRGETQSLTSVTLGTKMDEQIIDGAVFKGYNRFLLHYNFPSFSTGETKPMRGPGRREIGHGNLAMRALKNMLPGQETNPYTIRIVSDILESNGSSSMATVCAGCLALMDAGVQVKKMVSGIAMGLITDETNVNNYAVLSDILGDEDHLGDMDFKVCGTRDGITACQMDIKVKGLTYEILLKALYQAKEGRMHILGEMEKTITAPRADYKPHAPRIVKINIPKEFIGAVIGPGGKVIQEMQRETGATIIIEEVGEFGVIDIAADNKEAIDAAVARIKAITQQPEPGEVYEGSVKSIMPYGAFVEFLPGKQGLLHISEISWSRLENLDGVLKEGDKVKVKLLEIDTKTGKFKLSRKALMPKPEGGNKPPQKQVVEE